MLAVFGKSKHQINTPTATIGIRGTGVYLEASPDLTYFCNCYGITDIKGINDAHFVETIDSKYHDLPKYITQKGEIKSVPFINRIHEGLMLIKAWWAEPRHLLHLMMTTEGLANTNARYY